MPELTPLAAGAETLTPLQELVYVNTTRLGFFPDTALVEAPYPFPSATSYPGDTTGSTVGETLTPLTEDTRTLTPLTED